MNKLQIYRGSSPIQTGGIPVKIQVQVGSSVTLAPGLDSLHSCHLQHGGWLEQSTSDPNGDRNAPLIMFCFIFRMFTALCTLTLIKVFLWKFSNARKILPMMESLGKVIKSFLIGRIKETEPSMTHLYNQSGKALLYQNAVFLRNSNESNYSESSLTTLQS